LRHLEAQRDFAAAALRAIPGVDLRAPDGCYVLFPAVRRDGHGSESIAAHLLEHHRVAVVPGAARWFGPGAEGHIRICFSTSRGVLEEGLRRITAGLNSLR
jgi:aspartate/methionine/tyrosine aminotransferase